MLSTATLKGSEMSQIGTITKTQVNVGLTEPPMFKLIYLNDNATPMAFVMKRCLIHLITTQKLLRRLL